MYVVVCTEHIFLVVCDDSVAGKVVDVIVNSLGCVASTAKSSQRRGHSMCMQQYVRTRNI